MVLVHQTIEQFCWNGVTGMMIARSGEFSVMTAAIMRQVARF
jgi:hypothetical protein